MNEIFASGPYRVYRAGERHWRIEENQVFMDLVVGEHHALLFDTGYGFGDLAALIRGITALPLYVLNSHGHVDHACGNWQFGEAFLHPEDVGLCIEHNSPKYRADAAVEAELPADFDRDAYVSRGYGHLRPAVEGDVFDLGGATLRVVELPGHTRGSIGLFWDQEQMLFVGDGVNGFLWLFLPEATDLETYRRTLWKVRELPFQWMVLSHEGRILSREPLADYIRLAEELDYDAWPPVDTPLSPGNEVKIITLPGNRLEEAGRPGFAAIMISRDKVK